MALVPRKKRQHTQQSTSWGGVAGWYGNHLNEADTYHATVILPYILRSIGEKKGVRTVLEIGCGQGFFARALGAKGYQVTASDVSPELIALGKKASHAHTVAWSVADAAHQKHVATGTQDLVLAVLTLQNMRHLEAVCKEVARVLSAHGHFLCVINHPAFRIPKSSHWEYDGKNDVQYRRIERYMSVHEIAIDMQPGKRHGKHEETITVHRPLSVIVRALSKAGLCVVRMEELVSNKHSDGLRAKAENHARKEIPLFMVIEARKFIEKGEAMPPQ